MAFIGGQRPSVSRLVGHFCRAYSGEMKKDDSITMRLTREAKAKLKELAAADGRKLANYVTRVLESHIEQKERKAHKKSLSNK